jgi:hypothetical protein
MCTAGVLVVAVKTAMSMVCLSHRLILADHLRCCCTVPGAYTYDSKLTGNRYVLNTDARIQREAEAGCIALGGHLVSYTSAQEQVRPAAATAATPCA